MHLANPNSIRATFVAPAVSAPTTLTFQLLIHDSPGGPCDISNVSTQISVTVEPVFCAGDCDGKGNVTVNEIITLVNMVLGSAAPAACPHGIANTETVDVTLIVKAVGYALGTCPQ